MKSGVWECECGNIEYGKFPPEECSSCWKLNCFTEIPEDMVEKVEGRVLEKIKLSDPENEEEDEEEYED